MHIVQPQSSAITTLDKLIYNIHFALDEMDFSEIIWKVWLTYSTILDNNFAQIEKELEDPIVEYIYMNWLTAENPQIQMGLTLNLFLNQITIFNDSDIKIIKEILHLKSL